mgnify:FL=1
MDMRKLMEAVGESDSPLAIESVFYQLMKPETCTWELFNWVFSEYYGVLMPRTEPALWRYADVNAGEHVWVAVMFDDMEQEYIVTEFYLKFDPVEGVKFHHTGNPSFSHKSAQVCIDWVEEKVFS